MQDKIQHRENKGDAHQHDQHNAQDQPIEEVDSFVYMGSIVNKTGGADEVVKVRIPSKPSGTTATYILARNSPSLTLMSRQYYCMGRKHGNAQRHRTKNCKCSPIDVSAETLG